MKRQRRTTRIAIEMRITIHKRRLKIEVCLESVVRLLMVKGNDIV